MRKPPGRAETSVRFDYGALDSETRQYVMERAKSIHDLTRMAANGIMLVGQYLAETKERLGHGRFLDWVEREFAWKERTARNLMMVYECFKSANFADLQIEASALYLIAAPSTPEPVRTEIIRRAESGEPVTHAGAKALRREFKETGVIQARPLAQLIEARRPLELAPASNRFEELTYAVRFIAGMSDAASDTWCGLFAICAFSFSADLNRALDYLGRLRRAHADTEAS